MEKLAVAASATSTSSPTAAATSSTPTSTATSASGGSARSSSAGALSHGAIAGIVIGALALFFALVLIGAVAFLLARRNRYAELAAAAAAENQEKSRQTQVLPGNLFTQSEYAAATARPFPGSADYSNSNSGRRPSVEQTDSNDSMPVIIHDNPLARETSQRSAIVRPESARIFTYTRRPGQAI